MFILSSANAFNLNKSKMLPFGKELTFPEQQILGSSNKQKERADDNFKFDNNGRKVFQKGRKHWENEKSLIMNNFSFSHGDFKRLVLQTRKNQGLFAKGLK